MKALLKVRGNHLINDESLQMASAESLHPITVSSSRMGTIAIWVRFMGISPMVENTGQQRLQSTPQSKLPGPAKGEQHGQHTAGRNES